MEESQKSCKFAASVDWMMEPVDRIELVNGVGLAVASGSRLDSGTSRLDQARRQQHAVEQQARTHSNAGGGSTQRVSHAG